MKTPIHNYFCHVKGFINIVVGLIIVGLVLACDSSSDSRAELEDFVPPNPSMVLSISNFEILRADLQQNAAFKNFNKSELHGLLSGEHAVLKLLKPGSRSLLSIHHKANSAPDYAFITRQDSAVFELDSLQNIVSEKLSYGKLTLDRIRVEDQTVYKAVKDSILLLSSSQKMLEDMLSGKGLDNSEGNIMPPITGEAELIITRNSPLIKIQDSIYIPLSSRQTLNITVASGGITASGVAMNLDTLPRLVDIFKGQIPQQNTIASIHPNNARSSLTFTFNQPDTLLTRLRKYRSDSLSSGSVAMFETITEISDIHFTEGNAVVMSSIDAALTNEAMAPMLSENTVFRDVEIYDFSNSEIFIDNFSPLIPSTLPTLAFRLEHYFVFAETMDTAEKIIVAFKSNNVLANSPQYERSAHELATASSLLLMHLNDQVPQGIANVLFDNMEVSEVSLSNYPLSALQYSYDRNFAHVNYVCLEAGKTKQITGSVAQVFSTKLEADLLGDPQFFTNHRTASKDVVVQDMENRLYLISSNGKVLWKKNLKDAVLGKIHEVDILRNGKKQLVFNTKNSLFVVDRNGNDVAPFPVKFKDEITQPRSVFDYDNNRKYRFAIVQGKELLLYDSKGKVVKGFKFQGATSDIVMQVQHIRMSNKDYILVAEENGKLNILSRVGKSRVPVSKRFKFGETPIAEEGSKFVVITSDNTKVSISQGGSVNSQKLNVSNNYSFDIAFNTKVTLDDNLLRINGKLVELPFGIYTQPGIFRVKGETYISITETQENKVYVYTTSGDLLSGFPVYGTSAAELSDPDRSKLLQLLVRGESNEVILYELQ
jgi:hypothetical protein